MAETPQREFVLANLRMGQDENRTLGVLLCRKWGKEWNYESYFSSLSLGPPKGKSTVGYLVRLLT